MSSQHTAPEGPRQGAQVALCKRRSIRVDVARWAREPGNKPLYHQARERLAQVRAVSENPYTAAKALGLKIG